MSDSPRAVEYDPVNKLILTLNVSSKVLSILDADAGTEVARVEMPGRQLYSLAIDDAGERAYVGTASGVSVIDLGTLAVVREVPLLVTKVLDMAFDPATGILYAAVECNKARHGGGAQIIDECRFRSALVALDGSSGELLYEIVIIDKEAGLVSEVAIDSTSQTAYVTASHFEPGGTRVGDLRVVDLESRTVMERIDLPGGAGPLAVDEAERIVYVAAGDALILLDADSYEVVRTIEGSLDPLAMALSSTTGRVYVTGFRADTVGTVVFGR